MGGGRGIGLDFGYTWGSGRLQLDQEPETIALPGWNIGKSLGAAALNYDVRDPVTGKRYRFAEGTNISSVEVFAGKGVRKKLRPAVVKGLCNQYGGRPRAWQHAKGIGTVQVGGRRRTAEVHWFQEPSVGKVGFKIKEWLS